MTNRLTTGPTPLARPRQPDWWRILEAAGKFFVEGREGLCRRNNGTNPERMPGSPGQLSDSGPEDNFASGARPPSGRSVQRDALLGGWSSGMSGGCLSRIVPCLGRSSGYGFEAGRSPGVARPAAGRATSRTESDRSEARTARITGPGTDRTRSPRSAKGTSKVAVGPSLLAHSDRRILTPFRAGPSRVPGPHSGSRSGRGCRCGGRPRAPSGRRKAAGRSGRRRSR